jgi:hypothetical protein
MKILGPKSDAMGLFGAQAEEEAKVMAVKSTFKIEINDEEKKVRDAQ